MLRLQTIWATAVLTTALVAPVHAERISASISYEVAGFGGLSKEMQATANNQAAGTLQKLLGANLNVLDLQSGPAQDGFGIKIVGDWEGKAPTREAAEIIRTAAIQAANAVNVARTSVSSFRVEVDNNSSGKYDFAGAKEELEANRNRARPQPRIDIEGADPKTQTFQHVCMLDVPLIRALDLLSKGMPVAFVLHSDAVGRGVYVNLVDAPLDVVLRSMAESAGVKIEKRDQVYVFSRVETHDEHADRPKDGK